MKESGSPLEQALKRQELYLVFSRLPRQTALGTEVRNRARQRLTKDHGREGMSLALSARLESP